MRSVIIRVAILVAACFGMLFVSASPASATGDPICDNTNLCRPCPPGTNHRIGPICYS